MNNQFKEAHKKMIETIQKGLRADIPTAEIVDALLNLKWSLGKINILAIMDPDQDPPQNPYPENIFPATIEDIIKTIPDPKTRTAISGSYGRHFWSLAVNEMQELDWRKRLSPDD